jgi:squalene synthase HpnC
LNFDFFEFFSIISLKTKRIFIKNIKEYYTTDEAFAYCASITEAHYENFPVASFFLPQEKRPYIQALYAFSRIADDFADELQRPPEDRLNDIDAWEEQLRRCYEGEADHPVFIALLETIKRYDIPIDPLRDLLAAFKRDVTQNRYETFEDLLSYSRCSANPVGRLILMIFNYREESMFEYSDSICTALQLANFWQDVEIDRQKDRLYIPLEDFERFKYSVKEWQDRKATDGFRELMKYEVQRTKDIFYRGAKLPSLVAKDLQLELKLIWFGGMEILRMIEKQHYNIIENRLKLGTMSKVKILLLSLFVGNMEYFRRKRPRKEPWDLT